MVKTKSGLEFHPIVFPGASSIILLFVILGITVPGAVGEAFNEIQSFIVDKFSWFYVLSMTGFLLFAIYLTFSRFGNIKLGPDDSEPEFSRLSWFAMLFSAGMGIGLLFYSVAEPIMHYDSPPMGEGHTLEAARKAMALTFFHWGLHPWACYALMALILAYFGFRRNLPLSIRSVFYPLIGDRVHGPIGDVVDILAVCSTMFGVATSLGLGAMQVNAGMNYVFGLEISVAMQITIIVCITLVATWSVLSGLDVGIRRLSEGNMILASCLLLFIFLAGPTFYLLNAVVENFGAYFDNIVYHSFWTGTFAESTQRNWLSSWTVFYWAWWIAWSPFVGMFIARISKGRTIREFMLAVLLVPTVMGGIWLTIFGNSALYQELEGAGGLVEMVSVGENIPKALFLLLEHYPLATITSFISTICIILFFVTSSDSASMVIDIIASGGNEDPPKLQRLFWAVTEGCVAIALLMAGGLQALQTVAITAALPFCVVLVGMCYSLLVGLRRDLAGELHDHELAPSASPDDFTEDGLTKELIAES